MVESVRKAGSEWFDLMLLGEVRPSQDFLDERIVLVTHDVQRVLNFLVENGFDSPSLRNYQKHLSLEKHSVASSGFRNTIANIMRDSSDSSQNIVLKGANILEASQPRPAHHWMIDKEDPQADTFVTYEVLDSQVKISEADRKKVIKKIKNAKGKSKEDILAPSEPAKSIEGIKELKEAEPSLKRADPKRASEVVVSQEKYQYSSPKAEESSPSTHQRTYENERYQNSNSSSNGYSSPTAKNNASPDSQHVKPPLGL